MSLIIDLIIIIVAAASVYLGWARGFIKSVMSFVSIILAIIAVYLFASPLALYLNESFIDTHVQSMVEDGLSSIVSAGSENLDLEKILSDRPEALENIVKQFGGDLDEIIDYYNNALANASDQEALSQMASKIATPTANALSSVLATIIIFVAAMLLLKFITWLLDLIFRLPVLKKLNSFLGLLFGIGSAIVISWVVANIAIGLITALETIDSEMFNRSVISGSVILRFFHENSLIVFD